MKILSVISSIDPKIGGPAQGIRSSISILRKQGIEREVVCFDHANADFIKQADFTIYALGKARTGWQYNSKFKAWLKDNLCKYDKVIIHGLWLYHSYAVIDVIRKLKKKKPEVFVMPHGMLDPWFQKDSSRKLKAIRNRLYWFLVENTTINKADGILFTCEQEMLLARTTFPNYHPQREIIIGYGISHPLFSKESCVKAFEESFPLIKHEKYFLFLSRIHYKKGTHLLLRAYLNAKQKLSNEGIDIPKLIIAGPGLQESYGQELLKIVENDKTLSDHVVFTGMLQNELKWGALYGAELFVLPSFQENFGIAVVEALACQTPVLISNQINIWKEIIDMKGGLMCSVEVESIEEKLLEFCRLTLHEKAIMKTNAYLAFQKYFNLEDNLKKMSYL